MVGVKWRGARCLSRVLVVGALGVVLSGCGGTGTPGSRVTPSTIPATTIMGRQPVILEPVVWTTGIDASTGEPVDRVESFPRDVVSIHAAVHVRNCPAGGTLTAAREINGSPIEALATTIEVVEAQTAGWSQFRLAWSGETRWPVGTLSVRIPANTGESVEGAVRIR